MLRTTVEGLYAGDLVELLALGEVDGDFGGALAEFARVLPDRDGLRAERDAVQSSLVGVLAGNRHGAGETLGVEGCDCAPGGAVVGGDDRVNLVVVGGQELLHVALRVLRQPAVGVSFADVLDLASIDGGLQHFHLAGEEEVGVRVGRRALDEDVVALRLGLQHVASLHAAHFLVVEGDVEGSRIFDQAVVADNRNAFVGGLFDGRADGVGILRENDESAGTLGNQGFNVGQLLRRRRLGVGGNILGAGCRQSLLDGCFIRLPTLFLEVGPGNADDEILGEGGRLHGQNDGRACGQLDESFHVILPSECDRTYPELPSAAAITLTRKAFDFFLDSREIYCQRFFQLSTPALSG
ncbi:hypothetical protein RHSP_51307 [Rhizobium freirei PRF 81]|uniref:Uncharacterized protein n=1 Tax=Rhizobium freirei PRF 81 TaxID=363754 RepID=N6UD17_9HYPH|nr:hypothetical protein RHSP_51307 [Rhizobium freirei PRF 81]